MEAWIFILSWGSPVGLGLFLLFMGLGMWAFFLGVSKLDKKKK